MQSRRLLTLFFSLTLAILGWYLLVWLGEFPAFILPTPDRVAVRFWQALHNGSLLRNSAITLQEVLVGLALGVSTSTALGYLLAKSRPLERLLTPFIVASQSIPTVAIAPLLMIWFKTGMLAKTLICAMIVFFPVLINTMVGMRAVPDRLRELMRSLCATRWQTFRLLEVPATLPVFLGGLRIGATLSVIGAVVGEFIAPNRGLGMLINTARGQYDTAMVFALIFTLVAMALSLYGLVVLLEARLLRWREK